MKKYLIQRFQWVTFRPKTAKRVKESNTGLFDCFSDFDFVPVGIFNFFTPNKSSTQSNREAHSIRALTRPRERPSCGRFNCHITSVSVAVLLSPVVKPLISVSVHSDCWLTKLRWQESKLFPLPGHIPQHIPFFSRSFLWRPTVSIS